MFILLYTVEERQDFDEHLPGQVSYSVFKTITDQFLRGVDTRGELEVRAQSCKAALAIDIVAKLTTVDNHPMNRVLGFGTKYLRDNFSPWVQQHGGWVSASCLKMNLPRIQRRWMENCFI